MATQQPQQLQPHHPQQPPTAPQNRLTQPKMQNPQNSQGARPEPLPRHKQSLSSLQAMLNGILVETGKAIRSANQRARQQSSAHPSTSSSATDTERLQIFLPSAIPKFHGALDDIEAEIVRARAVVARDLRVLRARRDGVSVTEKEEVTTGENEKQDDAEMEVDSAVAQPTELDQQPSQPKTLQQSTPAQSQTASQPQLPNSKQIPNPAPQPTPTSAPRSIAMVSGGLVTTSHAAAPIPARAPHTSPAQQSQRQLPQTSPRQMAQQQLPQQGMAGVGVMGGVGGLRKMPEDEIAFNQLPGTADNSPKRPNASLPGQQPQSSPHQQSQTQQQSTPRMASQAMNQASAVQAAQIQQGSEAVSQSQPFQSNQPQLPQPSQPQPTQQPSQLTQPQSQTQHQQQQNQGGTDDIDFDAMFGPPQNNGGETQNPEETDINFDDFFNDVPDMSATQNSASQDRSQPNGGGLGEDAAFDLDSFGLDHGMDAEQSEVAAAAGRTGEQGGVELGLGMIEGLESYDKMGGDDSMDGLGFSTTDQQPNQEVQAQQTDGTISGNSHGTNNAGGGGGDAQHSADQFDLANFGHDGAMDLDFGDGNGVDGSIEGGNVDMGNDGGASFDDLMMDFGNESGDMRGGGGGDEFDDFFNGL